jgi:hypothetical protein
MRACASDLALDRMETIAELCSQGVELTRDEINLFAGPMRACGSLSTTEATAVRAAARRAVCLDSASQGGKTMSIGIDACAAQETIVVTTRSSAYELVVLRGDRGDVLVRGGSHFTEFSEVRFLGSLADDGSLERHTIDVGLRMKFAVGEQFVITSPVQSFSRHRAGAALPECPAAR